MIKYVSNWSVIHLRSNEQWDQICSESSTDSPFSYFETLHWKLAYRNIRASAQLLFAYSVSSWNTTVTWWLTNSMTTTSLHLERIVREKLKVLKDFPEYFETLHACSSRNTQLTMTHSNDKFGADCPTRVILHEIRRIQAQSCCKLWTNKLLNCFGKLS